MLSMLNIDIQNSDLDHDFKRPHTASKADRDEVFLKGTLCDAVS
jgi:hypothetical protein